MSFNKGMYFKNFKYLLSLTGQTQRVALEFLGFTEAAVYQWKQGSKPSSGNLRRIARYFSETLSIPYDLFEDGKALLEKDFEKIFKENGIEAHSLQSKKAEPFGVPKSNLVTDENTSLGEISDHEKAFLASIRRLFNNRPDIPASEKSLSQIVELETLAGPGSDVRRSLIRMIQGLKQYVRDTSGKGTSSKTKEDDTD